MDTVVLVATIVRLLWSAWVVLTFWRLVGKEAKPFSWKGYGLGCFLSVVAVIMSGRCLGWW